MQESFFYTTTLEEKKRFTPDILQLNFAHLSPYKHCNILPFYSDKRILLWFTPQTTTQNMIVIPEAYLLYRACRKNQGDGLFIIEGSIDKLLVIKKGELEVAYCGYNLKEQQESLRDEYGMSDIYLITNHRADTMLQESLDTYPLWQYFYWYQAKESFKDQTLTYLNRLTLPIAALIATIIVSEYIRDSYIQNHYQKLETKYLELKKQNDPYRKTLKEFKNNAAFNNKFYHHILRYPNSIDVMAQLFNVVAFDTNNTIKHFKLSGEKVTLNIETNDAIKILDSTLQSAIFREFKIKSSRKIRKSTKEYVSYEGILKPLKDYNGE
jgi:hypothetical protein